MVIFNICHQRFLFKTGQNKMKEQALTSSDKLWQALTSSDWLVVDRQKCCQFWKWWFSTMQIFLSCDSQIAEDCWLYLWKWNHQTLVVYCARSMSENQNAAMKLLVIHKLELRFDILKKMEDINATRIVKEMIGEVTYHNKCNDKV